jgi:hypothetical protein
MNIARLVGLLLTVFVLSCRGDGPVLSEVIVVIQGGDMVRAGTDKLEVAMSSGPLIVPSTSWAAKPIETFVAFSWPASLTLVPAGNPKDTGFSLQITAYKGATMLVQRTVIGAFVPGRTVLLEVKLDDLCIDYLSCTGDYTCSADSGFPQCVAAGIDATMLPDFHGANGANGTQDASVAQGADAGADGSVPVGPCVSTGVEACYNGKDDDCNGVADCADLACQVTSMCVPGDDTAGVFVAADQVCPAGYEADPLVLKRGVAPTCEGCSCDVSPTTCTASVLVYDDITECSFEMPNTGTPHNVSVLLNDWMTVGAPGCPAPVGAYFQGFATVSMTAKDGLCTAKGKATPKVTEGESAKLCLPVGVGTGCAAHQACVPVVSSAKVCGAVSDATSCSSAVDTWYTGFTVDHTCGACRCDDGAGGSCSGMRVRAGSQSKCSDSTMFSGVGGYDCEDMYNAPLFLTGAPANKTCVPGAPTTGGVTPTGALNLCCLAL